MGSAANDRREDAQLVAAAKAGSKDAFAALVHRHRPMAVALAARLVDGPDVVADVVQEAAIAALVGLERLRAPERFGTWCAGIALNVARRWRREASAPSPAWLDWVPQQAGPDEAAEAAALAAEVQQAVGALAPGQRDAVLAFYWGERTHVEAAAELGITTGAVKARLHQARANLLPRLAHHIRSAQSGLDTKEVPSMPTASEPDWVRVGVADVRRSASDDPAQHVHVLVLQEEAGDRRLPIYIGAAEATALACSLESIEMPRPMAYTMAAGLARASGARVVDVRITTLAASTFYALVRVDGSAGAAEVDARPSDAVNLALVCDVPILIDAALFDADDKTPNARWQTEWRSFPISAPAIATEAQERQAELLALRCVDER